MTTVNIWQELSQQKQSAAAELSKRLWQALKGQEAKLDLTGLPPGGLAVLADELAMIGQGRSLLCP